MHGLAISLGSGALVLKELKINPEGPGYVRIVGRRAGIVAWLMSAIGIDTTTTFDVMEQRIDYTVSSLSGRISHAFPLSSVSNVGTGFTKPIIYLGVAALLLCSSIIMALGDYGGIAFFLFIGACVCATLYYLRKALTIFVQVNSGTIAIMVVKKSIIEDETIDESQARHIIAILLKLIEQNH